MFSLVVYRILFLPIFLLAMPYYVYRMIRRGGYGRDFKFRLGAFKKLPKRKYGKRRLWIQAVSVGEVKAIGKLINLLIESDLYEIVLTTTTSTAYEIAKNLYDGKVLFVGLFPFDFWLSSWLAWNKIFPHAAILVESEIWPEHVAQASKRQVPVIVVNGRVSDKTFSRYQLLKNWAAPVLNKLSFVIASDQLSAGRFIEMGVAAEKIKVSGNIKFDNAAKELTNQDKLELKSSLGFDDNDLVLLGSSTWAGEEEMLLKALSQLRKMDNRWKLLLVPRHAERRQKLVQLLKTSGFSWGQRSSGDINGRVDVCLADTTGELALLTMIADIVFVGKSLLPNVGGQSPLDAAICGVPIVYGNQMTNFKDICASLEQNKCVIKVGSAERAIEAIISLAKEEGKRGELSLKLKDWHRGHCGASEFVAEKLKEIAFAKK